MPMLQYKTAYEARKVLESSMHYPGLVVRRHAQQAFRLLRQPAFDPEASWSLIRHEETWIVHRIVYAPIMDEQDGTFHHNTYGSEGTISQAEAGDLVSNLTQFYLQPFLAPQGHLVLDGCQYGIRCGDMIREAQLSWRSQAPNQWAELRDWYANALSLFESHLPECSVRIQAKHPWVE